MKEKTFVETIAEVQTASTIREYELTTEFFLILIKTLAVSQKRKKEIKKIAEDKQKKFNTEIKKIWKRFLTSVSKISTDDEILSKEKMLNLFARSCAFVTKQTILLEREKFRLIGMRVCDDKIKIT